MAQPKYAPLVAVALLCCLLSTAQAQASNAHRIRSIVTLGDSVSDTGLPNGIHSFNNATWPYAQLGYYQGRFSNGPVWPEYLAYEQNLTLVGYAVGGASSNDIPNGHSLGDQVRAAVAYLQANPLPRPALAAIAIAANDIMDLSDLPNVTNNATATMEYVNNIVGRQVEAAQALLAAGVVDHFVFIPTSQAIRYSPLGRLAAQFQPSTFAELSHLVWVVNVQMQAAVRNLAASVRTSRMIYLDIGLELKRIDARPSRYGLTNVKDSCQVYNVFTSGYTMVNGTMQPATLVSTCRNPLQYFFWDILHPTTKGHKLTSDFVTRGLKSAGLLP